MNEYITVVQVDIQQPKIALICEPKLPPPSSFVTVLSINNNNQNSITSRTNACNTKNGEIITVYRLPGERLGFGLKFQGGTKTDEKVERLFIQSCDANSPASKALASWGCLGEGDEILEIDNQSVTNMTRIECVKSLKDKNVAINLLVQKADQTTRNDESTKRALPPSPPKVPPRKILGKKPQLSYNDMSIAKLETETPVAAENYLNSLDDNQSLNESDETGSTISSQISVISNFSSESDLSSLLSTANPSSDLTRILTKPFQMIEREFNVNGNSQIHKDNLLQLNDLAQANKNINCVTTLINDAQRYENIEIIKKTPPTPLPRGSISILSSEDPNCNTNESKKIESWLNDAAIKTVDQKTISEIRDDSFISPSAKPIKFECFAAVDDAELEKLGPSSELLNISEAYFNFPWSANVSNTLPTIGEAEEEFSSMEQQRITVDTGSIFIVHDKVSNDITRTKSEYEISHRRNMEINNKNNINSPYLRASEDKSDNLSAEKNEIMHTKNRSILSMDISDSYCDREISDSDMSMKEICAYESENILCSTQVKKFDIETDKTSATAAIQPVANKNTSNILVSELKKMDQAQIFSLKSKKENCYDNAKSIIQNEGREVVSLNAKVNKQAAKNKSSDVKILPKATAIVAPQRKVNNFEENTHFSVSKHPFKSATLGRPPTTRSSNWRNKDEKSEKSVKDKIAMFSNSTSDISLIMPKSMYNDKINYGSIQSNAKSIENIFAAETSKKPQSKFSAKKAMSMENLDDLTDGKITDKVNSYTLISKPMRLQNHPPLLNFSRAQSVEHLMMMSSPVPSLYPSPLTAPIATIERRISFNGHATEENRQKSIANILESRKKNISKLRGLVIPDKVPENDLQNAQRVFDLPVIRSKECELINRVTYQNISPTNMNTQGDFKEIESPLIKPRSLFKKDILNAVIEDKNKNLAPSKPPRTSLFLSKPLNLIVDDSDMEACSRIVSPPISPMAKKPLVRTLSSNSSLSSNSTLTSGSGQASCSSNCSGSTEPNSITNLMVVPSSRKSIVASSKSRSGRDCLEKSWRDEDSTDGGVDNDNNKPRFPKSKTRSLTNYRLAASGDNLVDKVINVATFIEVISSDCEDKNETSSSSSTQKTIVNQLSENIQKKWINDDKNESFSKNILLPEIRKSFENQVTSSPPTVFPKTLSIEKVSHNRYSSWESVASSSSGVSSELVLAAGGSNSNDALLTNQSDFGSFSSFGSSHSLITPQDLQLIIDEADPPLEKAEAFVVVLQRENSPESSIGITLAGGSDYEAKEITIHRILVNSPADKDGRLKKGDRILSVNGLSMRGLTHRESLSVLKSPRLDVIMVVTRSKSSTKTSSSTRSKLGSVGSLIEKTDNRNDRNMSHTHVRIQKDSSIQNNEEGINVVTIIKDGTGIGVSLDGGFDGPFGNKPLIVKKIFMGGAAEKLTNLKANDEILEINGLSTEKLTRIDVWNMIKKVPQGHAVQIKIKK